MKSTGQVILEYTSIVAASPEAVFHVISDPHSKLSWVPAIRRVGMESDTPIGLGTHFLASAGIGPVEFVFREQIMEWVENQCLAYGGQSLWDKFNTIVNIEPHNAGTRMNYRMDYIFPGGRIGSWIGRFLTGLYRKGVEARTAAQFKHVVENSLCPWKVNKPKCLP
jgi:uncharacterized protein YndB with AHSA1/START domain